MKQTVARLALVWLILLAFVVQGSVLAGAEEAAAAGTVTLNVATAEDLKAVKEELALGNTVNVTLTADLVLDQWESLGTERVPFTGTFNGGGHTVTINEGKSLLGMVSGATVENIMVFGTVKDSAALAVSAVNSNFTDCGNAAQVTGTEGGYACGLVSGSTGINTYTRCFNSGIVMAENGTVCGIVSDNKNSGSATLSFKNVYEQCYNVGTLIGSKVYAIALDSILSSGSSGGNYSTVDSNGSQSVTYNKVLYSALASGSAPTGWGTDWRYIKGMYPMTNRTAVTNGDIAATAAAWVEESTLYLYSFDEGTWKTENDVEIQTGSQVTLPQDIAFEYLGLKRTVRLEGSGTVTVQVTDAALLGTETGSGSGVYLEETHHLLEVSGLSIGTWSLTSGDIPEGLALNNDTLEGTITAKPGTYESRFRLRDPDTRQYALLDLSFTVDKASGGVACTDSQTTFNGSGQGASSYTLEKYAELDKIFYQEGTSSQTETLPVNVGTYTVTVTTKETEYYEADQATCTFTINPYALTADDFNKEELGVSQPCTGDAVEPKVSVLPLADCATPGVGDYTVSYKNNREPTYKEGTPATVEIQPVGNYTTADGNPIVIPFSIYVADVEVKLETGRGYTLGTAGTNWTLKNESDKMTYTGGSLFYVFDPGAYTFTPAV